MELYRQPGSKYWTADFIVDGQRIRKSTKQTTKGKALEVAAEFLRQAQDKEAPALKSRAPRVREFAENKFYRSSRPAPSTQTRSGTTRPAGDCWRAQTRPTGVWTRSPGAELIPCSSWAQVQTRTVRCEL